MKLFMKRMFLGVTVVLLASQIVRAEEDHANGTPVEASASPTDCGVLGFCKPDAGGNQNLFAYSCKGDNVVIKHCGEKSKFKISNIETDCVGDAKTVSRANFREFMKLQLNKTELHGKLGDISKEDLAAAKADGGKLKEAQTCQEKTEQELANIKNRLEQLGEVAEEVYLNKLQKQVVGLEAQLEKDKAQVKACQINESAIAKIEKQISSAVDTVCAKTGGVNVPGKGTFLHTVLSQYDPSKHPCDTEKNCDIAKKLTDGTVVGAVVARTINAQGVVQEFVKDKASGLVWGPEAPKELNFADAQTYCASKKDLGLTWSVPSKEDFRTAFFASNSAERDNDHLGQVLDVKNKWLWSSSVSNDDSAWFFSGYNRNLNYFYRSNQVAVRCVGR